MDKEKQLVIKGGVLDYRRAENEVSIIQGRAVESRMEIPDEIEGLPVTKIEKKAFLSSKQLKEIILPRKLKSIGDWAFAYCSQLKSVWLPKKNLSVGRGVFKECESLFSICHLDDDSLKAKQAGRLLGAVPVRLEADYLFVPEEAGEEAWLFRFDEKLKEFLAVPDEEGYTKMVYCGEEDIVANMDLYLAERRRAKARLCFLRLINDIGLSDKLREALSFYLASHTKGCDSEAAWEVVFQEHGNEQEYYETFTGADCLTEENYDSILDQMKDQYPEMKGYLMRYKSQDMCGTDFFDLLSLD
jgi:hypothetical protein